MEMEFWLMEIYSVAAQWLPSELSLTKSMLNKSFDCSCAVIGEPNISYNAMSFVFLLLFDFAIFDCNETDTYHTNFPQLCLLMKNMHV